MDGLDDHAGHVQVQVGRVLRRGAGQPAGLPGSSTRSTARTGSRTSARSTTSTTRRSTARSPSGRPPARTAVTAAARPASTTPSGSTRTRPSGAKRSHRAGRGAAAPAGLDQPPSAVPARGAARPAGRLVRRGLSTARSPLLLVSAFWTLDPTTHDIVHQLSLANFQKLVNESVYPTIALRTTVIAGDRDRRRRRDRLPHRLLHGPRRLAPDSGGAGRRRPAAAVGQLPRPGLCLARDPVRQRARRLGVRAAGRAQRGLALRHLRPVDDDRLHLPLAAVHDPAHLRRPRAHPVVATSRRRRTWAGGPGRRSAGSSCRSPSRPSRPARSSPSR